MGSLLLPNQSSQGKNSCLRTSSPVLRVPIYDHCYHVTGGHGASPSRSPNFKKTANLAQS